jgi:hypothetical protein
LVNWVFIRAAALANTTAACWANPRAAAAVVLGPVDVADHRRAGVAGLQPYAVANHHGHTRPRYAPRPPRRQIDNHIQQTGNGFLREQQPGQFRTQASPRRQRRARSSGPPDTRIGPPGPGCDRAHRRLLRCSEKRRQSLHGAKSSRPSRPNRGVPSRRSIPPT